MTGDPLPDARNLSKWQKLAGTPENELTLELELPGLRPESVEITAESGILTVRGEKRTARKEDEQSRYHVVERAYGTFLRTFQLPQGIDESQIAAEFDNGVLKLRIPKTALPRAGFRTLV